MCSYFTMWRYVEVLLVMAVTMVLAKQPHIVIIVADDLGWNDVSFNGADQIPTPNIDALAFSGKILHRHYVQPLCTPTRAALMTAQYPIRLGLQARPIRSGDLRALPPGKILPEYLRERGYATHAVGKWHLGYYEANMTPTFRGFDSHLGYWNAFISYYEHDMGLQNEPRVAEGTFGHDLRFNLSSWQSVRGTYATHVFSERAEEVIAAHDAQQPLFLYVAHLAVHAGNAAQLLEAPLDTVARFRGIRNPGRRVYAAMVSEMDDAVGRVVAALQQKDMLQDSLILFMADNGAPTIGSTQNWGSNYPLRGMKETLWDGGVRGNAVLWGPMLKANGELFAHLIHVTDWLPTLYAAAGGDPSELKSPVDGLNQWPCLTTNASCPRSEALLNIDEVAEISAYIFENWKLIQGQRVQTTNGFLGESGRAPGIPPVRFEDVRTSVAGKAILAVLGHSSLPESGEAFTKIRREATIQCASEAEATNNCTIQSADDFCLFDLIGDPCEKQNVADKFPDVVENIKNRLKGLRAVLMSQRPVNMDLERADPSLWSGTWTPWVTCARDSQPSWCNASPLRAVNEVAANPLRDLEDGVYFDENGMINN